MKSLKEVLIENKVPFDNGKIALPNWVKRINIDIGLSFDAPHTQNWIDNDENNDLMVFGFEANPFWIEYLTSEVKNNKFKDFHTYTKPLQYKYLYNKAFVIPIAIDDVADPCTMDLYVPSISEGCGSLLKPKPLMGDISKVHKVPVYSLKEFLDLIPFDKIECIDYIKIDVQGCDINVIKSIGKHYLQNHVVYITAEPETEQYENAQNNSIGNIIEVMKNEGFLHIDHPNTKDPTFLNSKFENKKETYIWQYY